MPPTEPVKIQYQYERRKLIFIFKAKLTVWNQYLSIEFGNLLHVTMLCMDSIEAYSSDLFL